MLHLARCLAALLAATAAAALLPPAPVAGSRGSSRRAVVSTTVTAAAAAAASALVFSPCGVALAASNKKEYLTLSEYEAQERSSREDKELFGLFETLRYRADQTREFDSLAEKRKYKQITELALAWDSGIRQEVLDVAKKRLPSNSAREQGSALSKAVLNDLKSLDRLAKAETGEGVPELSASLREHVLQFTLLEPQRLVDRYGGGGDGALSDL